MSNIYLKEAIGCPLARVLVPDEFDLGERVIFPHQAEGVPNELLGHVGLKPTDPKDTLTTHDGKDITCKLKKKEPGLASINSWQSNHIMFTNETNHFYI